MECGSTVPFTFKTLYEAIFVIIGVGKLIFSIQRFEFRYTFLNIIESEIGSIIKSHAIVGSVVPLVFFVVTHCVYS